MDQDETRNGAKPRPWPHSVVSDGDAAPPPSKGQSPQFSDHFCFGETAGWIKMPLGRKVGLEPDDIVLDGYPAALPQKGAQQPPLFGHAVAKRRDESRCHLVWK